MLNKVELEVIAKGKTNAKQGGIRGDSEREDKR